jgi:hypothetical protein
MAELNLYVIPDGEPMTNPIDPPLDDDDRLAEPPLVDLLHYERGTDGFSVTFVPSTGDEATRFVFVPRDSVEGRQIAAYLYRVQQLIGNRIEKVVHAGGGDYTLSLGGGAVLRLSDEACDEQWAPEVFDHVKQIAVVAETAFNIAHAGQH